MKISRRTISVAAVILTGSVLGGFLLLRSPGSEEEQLALAVQTIEQGDLARFDVIYDRLRTSASHRQYGDFLSGLRLLKFGSTNAALTRFSMLTPTGQLREPLLFYTAQALHQANRLPEAEVLLRTLLKENPDNAEAHRWLGILYYDLGAYDVAIHHMNELLRLAPADFRPYRLLGMMYRDFEQDKEAIAAYQAALKLNPPDEIRNEMAVELAASLVSQKQYDEALSLVLPIEDSARAETLKSRCFLNAGRLEEANQALEKARQLDPEDLTVLLLEAEFKTASDDRSGAVESLQDAVARFPNDAECRYQLGLALRDIGQAEDAAAQMEEWNRLKSLATQLSEKNFKALANPHDITLRDELATLCEQLGKPDLAVMWRKAADGLRTAEQVEKNSLSETATSLPLD